MMLSKRRGLCGGSAFWRLYHSESAVYGYKPRKSESFNISNEVLTFRQNQSNFFRLVSNYREHGHKIACINPVNFKSTKKDIVELSLDRYGLSPSETVELKGIIDVPNKTITVEEATKLLKDIYCGSISYEFSYLESEQEREWFAQEIEKASTAELSKEEKINIAKELIKSQEWEKFLATKFPMVKRYSAEGAESMLAFFREVIDLSAKDDIKNIVLGMPHRGRLNLQTGLLKLPPAQIFRKFKGFPEFSTETKAMCDIAMHFDVSEDLNVDGKIVHFNMLNNPSHLEIVNPVSMGKARSKQMTLKEGDYSTNPDSNISDQVLNIQIHGDAAYSGQGVNQECLMLSQMPNFNIGGTIHMIVNNQLGFTTPADRGRSSRYSSDLAKCISAPVIHVNAENPELVAKATKLAFSYQRKFRKDVFIDFNCFRRWGHNELDDPTFTNPALYSVILAKKTIPDAYAESLISDGILTKDDIASTAKQHYNWLEGELKGIESFKSGASYFKKQWSKMTSAPNAIEKWLTGIEVDNLRRIGLSSINHPEDFAVHPHLLKNYVNARRKKVEEGTNIDWATAEAMCIGSLLEEGHNVRISGEDVGRGTFSHRHVMLVDQNTNNIYIPLNNLHSNEKGYLEVANSILSEEAVLGYEYGMAIDNPNNLIIWEAQFGDFFNGAQIVIDTYIAPGESKWMKSCGLVMLLPHGYDGAGSDHSSCRIERFLQLTDSKEFAPDGEDINVQIANPTTPAQYFHLLRRQMVRDYRKPLVVASPKILIRLPEATSTLQDMAPGTHFQPVLGDHIAKPSSVKRVILVSGKHYYALHQERIKQNVSDVAIIRVECLCPFPLLDLQEELNKYKGATKFIWSQEEHRNMGAWSFIQPRFQNLLGRKILYSGRDTCASTSVGVSTWHQQEAKKVVQEPLYELK